MIYEKANLDIRLLVAATGLDLRELYNEGVRMHEAREQEPSYATPEDRVRLLGWTDESERDGGD